MNGTLYTYIQFVKMSGHGDLANLQCLRLITCNLSTISISIHNAFEQKKWTVNNMVYQYMLQFRGEL